MFGYPDGRDINLAMERGEVEGRATNPWSSYISTDPQYVDNKLIIPIIQIGMQKESQLPDVPLMRDLAEDAEVLRIHPDQFRRIIVEDSELSDLFLRTFLARRTALIEEGFTSIKVIGSRYSRDTHRLREFLTRNSQHGRSLKKTSAAKSSWSALE